MPQAFRAFKKLKTLGFSESQAIGVASAIEEARGDNPRFSFEKISNALFDSGFEEGAAEAIAHVLRNCFRREQHACWFEKTKLKTELVRSKMPALTAEAFLDVIDPCIATRRTAELRLPINFHPKAGKVLMCDFTFLQKPEMQKERRAIVVSSPPASDAGRCTVVPVSKSTPLNSSPANVKFVPGSYPFFHRDEPVYAVCEHIYTLSYARMWQINIGRKPSIPSISPKDLLRVKRAIANEIAIAIDS